MKRTLAIIFILVVGVGALGWHFFTSRPKPVQPPPPKPVVARPTMPKRRLAPEGTYFLLQRASLTTNSTVIGFPPGTKLTMLKQDGSTSTVTDGQYQFDIASSQLTNDLDIAARVVQADSVTQKKILELIAKSVHEHEKQQQDEIAELEKQPADRERTQQPPARRAPNPLEHGPYNSTTARKYTDRNGRTYWKDVFGRPHYDP